MIVTYLQRAEISLRSVISLITNTISDDLTILQVNRAKEMFCVLRKVFCKLDVRRKSIVILTLS